MLCVAGMPNSRFFGEKGSLGRLSSQPRRCFPCFPRGVWVCLLGALRGLIQLISMLELLGFSFSEERESWECFHFEKIWEGISQTGEKGEGKMPLKSPMVWITLEFWGIFLFQRKSKPGVLPLWEDLERNFSAGRKGSGINAPQKSNCTADWTWIMLEFWKIFPFPRKEQAGNASTLGRNFSPGKKGEGKLPLKSPTAPQAGHR